MAPPKRVRILTVEQRERATEGERESRARRILTKEGRKKEREKSAVSALNRYIYMQFFKKNILQIYIVCTVVFSASSEYRISAAPPIALDKFNGIRGR